MMIDEDNFKKGYNKAYEELESKYWEKLCQAEKNIRNKVIDDFEDKLLYQIGDLGIRDIIEEIAEQLKSSTLSKETEYQENAKEADEY